MAAVISKGATRQREHTGLGSGVLDGAAACGLRIGRGMGLGDDKGHKRDETGARRRDKARGERDR